MGFQLDGFDWVQLSRVFQRTLSGRPLRAGLYVRKGAKFRKSRQLKFSFVVIIFVLFLFFLLVVFLEEAHDYVVSKSVGFIIAA